LAVVYKKAWVPSVYSLTQTDAQCRHGLLVDRGTYEKKQNPQSEFVHQNLPRIIVFITRWWSSSDMLLRCNMGREFRRARCRDFALASHGWLTISSKGSLRNGSLRRNKSDEKQLFLTIKSSTVA